MTDGYRFQDEKTLQQNDGNSIGPDNAGSRSRREKSKRGCDVNCSATQPQLQTQPASQRYQGWNVHESCKSHSRDYRTLLKCGVVRVSEKRRVILLGCSACRLPCLGKDLGIWRRMPDLHKLPAMASPSTFLLCLALQFIRMAPVVLNSP